MHRLFVALRPPAAVREALLALGEGIAAARWQDEDQLHLTVRYIGKVETPVAEDVATALSRVAAPALSLRLAGIGRFEDSLWAGVAPHDALAALHRKVDHALVRVELEPERRAYLPHITLARLRARDAAGPEASRWLADHAGLTSDLFTCAHLVLYESHLGHGGARYDAVARWPLG